MMSKNQQKDLATSSTATMFVVMAITGVLMFFHLFDAYTKELHEIIGLAFVIAAILHVRFNWNAMKNYFSKKVFVIVTLLIFIISMGLIIIGTEGKNRENPKKVMIESMLHAPIENTFLILSGDVPSAETKLKEAGIKVENSRSITDIANKNNISPFQIVSVLTKK